jgi:hypothetical protein
VPDDIEAVLEAIRKRHHELENAPQYRESFVAHLKSLSRAHTEEIDYPDPGKVTFPARVHVAFAVCQPTCGIQEFIVDGSTQECQKCGALMFRTEVAEYALLESSSA